jgi:hypothetical protein
MIGLVQTIALLTGSQEVLLSNPAEAPPILTDFPPVTPGELPGEYLKMDHYRFISRYFQFIIDQASSVDSIYILS